MLVLSRKEGESIEFPDLNVRVQIIQLKKSKVQLGIEAPREIQVDRSETVDRRVDESGAARARGREYNVNREELDQRLFDELAKLEVEVLALAELVASKDRDLARHTATVSLERMNTLRNTLNSMSSRRRVTRSIAEFMQSRCKQSKTAVGRGNCDPNTKTQDEPVSTWDQSSLERADCIRQAGGSYFLESDVSPIFGSGSLEAGHG